MLFAFLMTVLRIDKVALVPAVIDISTSKLCANQLSSTTGVYSKLAQRYKANIISPCSDTVSLQW